LKKFPHLPILCAKGKATTHKSASFRKGIFFILAKIMPVKSAPIHAPWIANPPCQKAMISKGFLA